MSRVTLVQAPTEGQTRPISPAGIGAIPLDTSQVFAEIGGSMDSVRAEVDDCFDDMKTFHNREPDEIMRLTRGHSARLSELKVRILRVEDFHRQWKNVRVREIEPTLQELSDQWANASRLHSVREFDYKVETGMST